MTIKEELQKLKEPDLWSLLLFALFKLKDIPEYSSISELSYILDRKNMLKLCEYYGGSTIRIPTIEELEEMIYGLSVYQQVNIEGKQLEDVLSSLSDAVELKSVKQAYSKIRDTLSNYDLTARARNDI